MKRCIALILACLLLTVLLPATLAESDAGELLADAIQIDEDSLLADADTALSQDVLPLEAPALPQLESVANAAAANASQTTAITVTKNIIKSVTVGFTYQIVVPGKTIKTCKSISKSVATVTKKGLITTLKTGTGRILITLSNGDQLKLKLRVLDKNVPIEVSINEGSSTTMFTGEKLQLSATVIPSTAPQKVTWETSKKTVATVSSKGVVTARKAGKATITALTSNGRKASFKVTVNKASNGKYMICHAMGGIDGNDYSNSLEAFEYNYAKGHRYFEVDFQYTSDDKLVLWHNWSNRFCSKYKKGYEPTYAQFMKSKIYDKYTPLDVEGLLKLMANYPDAYIITDTKYAEVSKAKREFKTIVSTAKKLGIPNVLDQFIVEVYTPEMFEAVDNIHHFNEYMASLYRAYSKAPSSSTMKSIANYCKKHGIASVGMYARWWKSKYTAILESYGIVSALYTVNDASDAQDYFDDGVSILFTDYLPPI